MPDSKRPSPPYGFAALIALAVLLLYIATLAPTTAFWDTSEYIAAAKTLGIPHPPGNPLFVLLAHFFGLLPLASSYAARINLFAAVTSALSAGLWFLVAERWLRNLVSDRGLRLGAAAAGVLIGATSWTVWNQSTVNEKVYTVSLLSIALGTWLAVHWGDDEEREHRDRWLVLIAYLVALTSTNHMMGVLAAPALAVYVLRTDWRGITRAWAVLMVWLLLLAVSGAWGGLIGGFLGLIGKANPGPLGPADIFILLVTLGLALWAAVTEAKNPLLYLGVAAVLVGVSLNYVFLPIRGAQFPPINEGEPTNWQALADVLNRVQYGKPSVFDLPWPPYGQPRTMSLFIEQLANYGQYFSWQFARDWPPVQGAATVLFGLTGLGGLWSILKKDRRAGIAALAMLGTLTLALVFYLNFKYGFSMYPDRQDITSDMREVRERDYFFVCSFAFFGTLIAAGIGAAAQSVATQFRTRAAALPLFALVLIPLFGNRLTASRSHEFAASDFARDVFESVEPSGTLHWERPLLPHGDAGPPPFPRLAGLVPKPLPKAGRAEPEHRPHLDGVHRPGTEPPAPRAGLPVAERRPGPSARMGRPPLGLDPPALFDRLQRDGRRVPPARRQRARRPGGLDREQGGRPDPAGALSLSPRSRRPILGPTGRGGRVVEGSGLENRQGRKSFVSSNLTHAASAATQRYQPSRRQRPRLRSPDSETQRHPQPSASEPGREESDVYPAHRHVDPAVRGDRAGDGSDQ